MNVKHIIEKPLDYLNQPLKIEGWLGGFTDKDQKEYIALKVNPNSSTVRDQILIPLPSKSDWQRPERIPMEEPRVRFLKLFEDDTYPLTPEQAAFHLDAHLEERREREKQIQLRTIEIVDTSIEHFDVFAKLGLIEEFAYTVGSQFFPPGQQFYHVSSGLAGGVREARGWYPGYAVGVPEMVTIPGKLVLKNVTEAAFEHPDYTFQISDNSHNLDLYRIADTPAVSVFEVTTAKEKYLNQKIHLKGFIVHSGGGNYLLPHKMYYRMKGWEKRLMLIGDWRFSSKFGEDNFEPVIAPIGLSAELRAVGTIIENEFGKLVITDLETAVTSNYGGLYIWKL